jgi:hypothetical protein
VPSNASDSLNAVKPYVSTTAFAGRLLQRPSDGCQPPPPSLAWRGAVFAGIGHRPKCLLRSHGETRKAAIGYPQSFALCRLTFLGFDVGNAKSVLDIANMQVCLLYFCHQMARHYIMHGAIV